MSMIDLHGCTSIAMGRTLRADSRDPDEMFEKNAWLYDPLWSV
jgi:hypothetical protein